MVSFTIRKYSKLLNPTTNEATWLHRPERSELLFSFEDIDTNTAVLKVIWRLTVFVCILLSNQSTRTNMNRRRWFLLEVAPLMVTPQSQSVTNILMCQSR